MLEEEELVAHLLYEEVLIAVGVDVDELRAGDVEPAEEGNVVGEARWERSPRRGWLHAPSEYPLLRTSSPRAVREWAAETTPNSP